MFRQGDVLIMPVASIPAEVVPVDRDNGRVVLAYGEVTGHAHAIMERNATLFSDPKLNQVFMSVLDNAVNLVHEEHNTIQLPPGNYRVIRQQEYSPEAIRNVAD